MSKADGKVRDRLALRATTAYFLRSVDVLARTVGGDILRGVIFLAIVDANVRHLRPGDSLSQTYSEADDVPPDALRKPVSIHALALTLALPYETTRRHVNKLMEEGMCVRRETGVVVPSAVLAGEAVTSGLKRNFEHLRQLLQDLREGGVNLEN